MARPERFELPTAWFVARYSIQLSYGRIVLVCAVYSTRIRQAIALRAIRYSLRRFAPQARQLGDSLVAFVGILLTQYLCRLTQLSYGRIVWCYLLQQRPAIIGIRGADCYVQ